MIRILASIFALLTLSISSIAPVEGRYGSGDSGIRFIEDIHNSKYKAPLEQKDGSDSTISKVNDSLCIAQAGQVPGSAPPPKLIPPPPPAAGTTFQSPNPAPVSIQNPGSGPNFSSGSDFTSQLSLKKGMKIVFLIRHGLDTRWKHVGNYRFEADIEFNDRRGYAFDWHMSPPANASGERRVDMEDVKSAHKVSLFYPDNESATLVGFTSIVRISDYLFEKLKAGEKVEFELDGPHSPLVMNKHTRPVPRYIIQDGYEDLNINIDGVDRPVRTVKGKTDIGWTYWILDNPNFPLMVQGNGPFQWTSSIQSFGSGGSGSNTSSGDTTKNGKQNRLKAKDEARKVIDQLTREGKATSYLILFDFDSDRLRPLSKEILVELSQYLKSNPLKNLRVEGHTCTVGGKDYNLNLSQRRAESVKKFLVNQCGISASKLIPIGYGFSKPVKTNDTEAGRQMNRRVVFTEIK